jgi:predicted membrane-bound dolichyl-phosphate-mannose-protein mannosyltransferase
MLPVAPGLSRKKGWMLMPVDNDPSTLKTQNTAKPSGFHALLMWFTRKENLAVCAIAVIVLILHLLVIAKPSVLMFDEKFYVPAARNYLNGGGLINTEHPPLGKWFIAAGITIFGDNAAGCRMPSVLFGIASIFLFYLICVRLVRNEADDDKTPGLPPQKTSWFTLTTFVPVFATFLFAFENMSFAQSGIAMLDVFYVTLMLAGFLFYLRGNYVGCGILMGLSILCKISAVLGILAILIHWAVSRRHEILAEIRHLAATLKRGVTGHSAILDIAKMLIVVAVLWIVLLPLLEYPAARQFDNPFSRFVYMAGYHIDYTTSTQNSPLVSMPWAWLTTPTHIIYWPDSTHVKFVTDHFALAIDSANPLWWSYISWNIWILIIPSILFLVYRLVKEHTAESGIIRFGLIWFFAVYVLLIPIELITGREMFTFYFYPAVPVVCLAIAWAGWKIRVYMQKDKQHTVVFQWTLALYIAATLVIFYLMSPFGGHLIFPS